MFKGKLVHGCEQGFYTVAHNSLLHNTLSIHPPLLKGKDHANKVNTYTVNVVAMHNKREAASYCVFISLERSGLRAAIRSRATVNMRVP